MRALPALLLLSGLAFAGCTANAPFDRPGTWRPSGANTQNLRVMVADPADLTRGVEGRGTDGQIAAGAVARLRLDKVKPLPASGVAEITPVQSGDSNSSSGGN